MFSVEKTVTIHSSASHVWQALTKPEIMRQWWADFDIDIITDWKVGSPITFNYVMYNKQYNDGGTVLTFIPEKFLSYSYCSTISPIPASINNYPVFSFELNTMADITKVTFTHTNIATEVDNEHSNFYWNVTLIKLKEIAESIK